MQYHLITKKKNNYFISKNIHSVFFEFFGRTIYDGIWVGKDSLIPNIDGLRKDVIDGIREMGAGTMRWPGGCCADHYHWKNGIGPVRKKRVRTEKDAANQVWRNDFGTDEFLKFCELTGTEPILTINTATGTPEEFLDWYEYVNGDEDTMYGEMRAKNGHPQPYNVKYWGVGNTDENVWLIDWNNPEEYGRTYRKFQTVINTDRKDLYLIGLGLSTRHNMPGWPGKALDTITAHRRNLPPDALSIHNYIGGVNPNEYISSDGQKRPGSLEFTDEGYYSLLDRLEIYQYDIDMHRVVIREHLGKDSKTKICFDEWGIHHPEATMDNNLNQRQCMRDGIFAALSLHIFYRNCDIVEFAHETQMSNLLQSLFETDGEKFYKTPTFYVMKMLFKHTGQYLMSALPNDDDPDLDTVATISETGDEMTVSIVNRHLYDAKPISFAISADEWTVECADIVTCDDVRAQNTFENPERICDKPFAVPADLTFAAPEHSVIRICLKKK